MKLVGNKNKKTISCDLCMIFLTFNDIFSLNTLLSFTCCVHFLCSSPALRENICVLKRNRDKR